MQMIDETDKLREERKHNEGVVPEENVVERDLGVVKNQILDLNDKFDYLVLLMLKGRKLAKVDKEFVIPNANNGNLGVHQDIASLKEKVVKFGSAAVA